jgi:hypothetical protein
VLIGTALADLGILPSRLWALLFAAVVEGITQWDRWWPLHQHGDEPADGFDGLTHRQVDAARRVVPRGEPVTDPTLAPAVIRLTDRDPQVHWWTWVLLGMFTFLGAIAVWAYLYSEDVVLALLWAVFVGFLLLTPLRRSRDRARRATSRASAAQLLAVP